MGAVLGAAGCSATFLAFAPQCQSGTSVPSWLGQVWHRQIPQGAEITLTENLCSNASVPSCTDTDSSVITAPGAWKAAKAVNRSPPSRPPAQICPGPHSNSSGPADAGRWPWPRGPKSQPSQRADPPLSQATLDQNTYRSGSPGADSTHIFVTGSPLGTAEGTAPVEERKQDGV